MQVALESQPSTCTKRESERKRDGETPHQGSERQSPKGVIEVHEEKGRIEMSEESEIENDSAGGVGMECGDHPPGGEHSHQLEESQDNKTSR